MKRSLALLFPLLLGGLLAATPAGAAPTPAGTAISNQASAQFEAAVPGGPTSATSNVVSTLVQAVCAVSVTPDGSVAQPGQTQAVLPGEQATFRYTLVNSGNGPATFPVQPRLEPASTLAPTLRVYADTNANGVLDSGEDEVSSVTLAPDASAHLLLVVDSLSDQGSAYVNVISGCASQSDSNNVSLVRVGAAPVLSVSKSFSPALIKPGMESTVSVMTRNDGPSASREVLLSDLLTAQVSAGMTFMPQSAQVNAGTLEYTADGVTWQTSEPAQVRGVRARLGSLEPGGSLQLSFRMKAGVSAENQQLTNVASVTAGAQRAEGSAVISVRYQPGVSIGPLGTPQAEEGSPADRQTRAFGVVGQAICFDHTLLNTGDISDNYTLTVTYPQGQASATLLDENAQPLAQPVRLAAGQSVPVRVCYSAQSGPLEALITVQGERGTQNATRDSVTRVEAGLPQLTKTVSPAGQLVSSGQQLSYTLSVRNPYRVALSNVIVSDALPAHVDFGAGNSVSGGGAVSGPLGQQVATWQLSSLAAGETYVLTVTATVSSRSVDGEALKNTFQMRSSELSDPQISNEVQSLVWNADLRVAKTVSQAQAAPGERLDYTLTIRNTSATTPVQNAVVTDTPALGLAYLAGTSVLNNQPIDDPMISGGVLTWNVGALPPGQDVVLTYATRVTPTASGDLMNKVQVVGNAGGSQTARAIASNSASAVTKLKLLNFAPVSDIVGRVFVDRNRNGLYDAGADSPIERARVLLAGGRLALSDKEGRYHFANVPLGSQALRLDPNSAPYPPLSVVQDAGLPGSRSVNVGGLTTVDFPLAPLSGEVAATRRSVLTVGPLRVEKTLRQDERGYVVTLKLTTGQVLSDFDLQDPLPQGAVLKEGRNSYVGTLNAGETTFTYRFDFSGFAEAASTDPSVRWRY